MSRLLVYPCRETLIVKKLEVKDVKKRLDVLPPQIRDLFFVGKKFHFSATLAIEQIRSCFKVSAAYLSDASISN